MSDGQEAGAEPRAPDPHQVQIGSVAAMFMRQAEFARGEALRLADEQERLLALITHLRGQIERAADTEEDAGRQLASLHQAVHSRDQVIAERDAEIAVLKEAAAVVRVDAGAPPTARDA